MDKNKQEAIDKANKYLRAKPVFLDTETTGLGKTDEIVEIAIIDSDGRVLLDTLVKPRKKIPIEATRVHGITNKMVEAASTWEEILPRLRATMDRRLIGIYNADFDIRMLIQSTRAAGLEWEPLTFKYFCVMKLYAQFCGETNTNFQDYKWHKLEKAGRDLSIDLPNSHRARSDAILTREVLVGIAIQFKFDKSKLLDMINYNHIERFENLDLSGVDLSGENLEGAYLVGANFDDAKFIEANLKNANLTNTYFGYITNMSGANLENAIFVGAEIKGANFTKSILKNSVFINSYIVNGADFTKADLRNADFRWALLSPVYFGGANLEGAKLTDLDANKGEISIYQLSDYFLDEDTIMPNGEYYKELIPGTFFSKQKKTISENLRRRLVKIRGLQKDEWGDKREQAEKLFRDEMQALIDSDDSVESIDEVIKRLAPKLAQCKKCFKLILYYEKVCDFCGFENDAT